MKLQMKNHKALFITADTVSKNNGMLMIGFTPIPWQINSAQCRTLVVQAIGRGHLISKQNWNRSLKLVFSGYRIENFDHISVNNYALLHNTIIVDCLNINADRWRHTIYICTWGAYSWHFLSKLFRVMHAQREALGFRRQWFWASSSGLLMIKVLMLGIIFSLV